MWLEHPNFCTPKNSTFKTPTRTPYLKPEVHFPRPVTFQGVYCHCLRYWLDGWRVGTKALCLVSQLRWWLGDGRVPIMFRQSWMDCFTKGNHLMMLLTLDLGRWIITHVLDYPSSLLPTLMKVCWIMSAPLFKDWYGLLGTFCFVPCVSLFSQWPSSEW